MSKQSNKETLNKRKTFYDPHPGLMGAISPIPADVKRVAKELDGKTMTLSRALAKIREVTNGKVELVPKYEYISLDIVINGLRNFYRVIRYK